MSRTGPEAGYLVREGKPSGFFYLDHRTVDGVHALITDIHVTPANLHDSVPYLARLDRMRQRFGFEVAAAGLDAGYFTPAICKGLEERGIYGVLVTDGQHIARSISTNATMPMIESAMAMCVLLVSFWPIGPPTVRGTGNTRVPLSPAGTVRYAVNARKVLR